MAVELPVVPGSCRLDAEGMRAQGDRYARLAAGATRVDRSPAEISIGLGENVDRRLIDELIATENECCPFYRFELRRDPAELVIGVERPEQRPALDAIAAALAQDSTHARLVRRARTLAWAGLGWHVIEAAIAVAAGLAASSVALIGFGGDSLIEGLAGVVVLWRFAARREGSPVAERRAQRAIAVSFYVLAGYVAVEAARTLIGAEHAGVSWVGIGLAGVTALVMPALAGAKARVGEQLGSSATKSEGRQNLLCAYLSLALLVGLGGNALVGWWWLDPAAALVVAAVAVREGRDAWRGESCCE
jgi:Cation efflux family